MGINISLLCHSGSEQMAIFVSSKIWPPPIFHSLYHSIYQWTRFLCCVTVFWVSVVCCVCTHKNGTLTLYLSYLSVVWVSVDSILSWRGKTGRNTIFIRVLQKKNNKKKSITWPIGASHLTANLPSSLSVQTDCTQLGYTVISHRMNMSDV